MGGIVIYTDKVEGGQRVKMLPLIKINPKYKDNKGLHDHEYEHVKQYLVGLAIGLTTFPITGIFSVLIGMCLHDMAYTFIRKYRQWAEVKAFKVQMKDGGSIDLAAKHLAEDYDLNISIEEAKRLLS